MKKYIAFYTNSNSGIQTKEKAVEWATEALTNTKVNKVNLAEVIETIERMAPVIQTKPFLVTAEAEETQDNLIKKASHF